MDWIDAREMVLTELSNENGKPFSFYRSRSKRGQCKMPCWLIFARDVDDKIYEASSPKNTQEEAWIDAAEKLLKTINDLDRH